MWKRYLEDQARRDLKRKMVFIGGPRQVGKTTLAQAILKGGEGYLNWDVPEDRERILRRELPPSPLLAFDEIHKYRSWRNYLKGLFDARVKDRQILITGSARLDLYRFGGDSLQGRYHFLRLFPLTVAELGIRDRKGVDDLLNLGGFPEPFFSGSQVEARRWSREYRARLIREDIVSLERVTDFGNMELLMLRLPELVGSPLSVNALREDLQVGYRVVSHWLQILERLYAVFRIAPLGGPRIRAVKKAQKHYQFDWSLVADPAKRFENLVALHLLKHAAFREDAQGEELEVRYFRDVDGREVDFVLVERRVPRMLVECKWGDENVAQNLRYLKARYPEAEAWQISATGQKDYVTPEGIRVSPAIHLLRKLT
jgi:predicted AAA+ superfamily ATPase